MKKLLLSLSLFIADNMLADGNLLGQDGHGQQQMPPSLFPQINSKSE